ncbi:hypothetical protein [Streptomyces sp. NPDC012746]|uniref:hypothetical protein n=1 Tax=Streptomyces sp. NPDC012746 TaxID=3364845 RepID=UPI003698C541
MTTADRAPHQAATEYERQLTAAGFGAADRQQYIQGSGQPHGYAACLWDEFIVPGAEAAGLIPTRPTQLTSPAEQALIEARRQARLIYWEQYPEDRGGYDPLSNHNAPGVEAHFAAFVEDLAAQMLRAEPEQAPADEEPVTIADHLIAALAAHDIRAWRGTETTQLASSDLISCTVVRAHTPTGTLTIGGASRHDAADTDQDIQARNVDYPATDHGSYLAEHDDRYTGQVQAYWSGGQGNSLADDTAALIAAVLPLFTDTW